MDSKYKFLEVHETYLGEVYTFEGDFLFQLMRMGLHKAVQIVIQIEIFMDKNELTDQFSTYEYAGVLKGKEPDFFKLEIKYDTHPVFSNIQTISSDDYLDYYNINLTL